MNRKQADAGPGCGDPSCPQSRSRGSRDRIKVVLHLSVKVSKSILKWTVCVRAFSNGELL